MNKSESREQIQSVVQQMRDVRNNRGGALRRMLNENEKITRETVSAELEVKNYRISQKRLKEEMGKLEKELQQATAAGTKAQESLKTAKAVSHRLEKKNTVLSTGIKGLRKEVDRLKTGNGRLQKTVDELEARRDKLSADAKRLKELRSKYLSELAKYKTGG